MAIAELLAWWYTAGWVGFCRATIMKVRGALSFFSIGQLFRTLFQPFRQISANAQGDSLEDRFHAFGDRLMSRCIGAVVRIFLMIAGIVVALVATAVGAVLAVAWLMVPMMPIAGIVLAIMGVKF